MPIKNVDLTKARFLMAGMSVGGLVSGLDTNSIVAQLTALEQMKVTRETQKKENAQKTLDKFKELQTRLGNLASKASALETQSKFNVFKSTSNYEDYVTVSGKEGATAGQYEVTVKQLATTQKVYSKRFDEINTPLVAAGDQSAIFGAKDSITISLSKSEAALKKDPTKKTVDIKISQNDTLKDIVNKINAAEGAGVRASIMAMANGDNRLVLTAVDTGTNGFQISDNSIASGATQSILEYLGILSEGSESNQIAASKNVLFDINGNVADKTTAFDQLSTVMGKNNFKDGDKLGIYLPINDGNGSGGWVTFDLYAGGVAKSIGDVLTEINTALSGSGANFTATLDERTGEIVLNGDLNGDQNFGGSNLKDVKIQMGTFNGTDFSEVKKDMGGLTSRSTFANIINDGQNAIYTIDGMTINSQSNSDDKTISGTIFNLKKATDSLGNTPVKVSLDLDKDALVGNITAFIDEFNALMSFINENAKTTVKEDTDKITGKKTTTREVGPFSGDSGISALRDNLKNMMTGIIDELSGTKNNGYSTNYSSASRIGITTQKDGTLGVDKDQLLKAINTDFEGVRRLFTSNDFSDTVGCKVGNFTKNSTPGTYEITIEQGEVVVMLNGREVKLRDYDSNTILENRVISLENGLSFELPTAFGSGAAETAKITFVRGIASQISNFTAKAKDTVDGYYKTSEKNYQARIDSIQKRVEELQIRVDNYNARITKQFAALERNMGNLQSQTANMMSALSAISYRR